ncbi:MAG: DUF962 domain-containing protein [Tatlockia sp.]|nr:DUF962 domain-containing protein [Tatlockia sp.]
MKSFIEQAQAYADCHQTPISRYTHFIGVPLIIFSLMVFFGFLHLVIPGIMNITLAGIATVALLCYYYYLNWRLALALTVILFVMLGLAHLVSRYGPDSTSLWVFIITFVLGWIFQLVGHFFEGKRAAFMNNFWQVLIAPMFLTAELFFLTGHMHELKREIEGEPDFLRTPIEPDNKL